ncbi:MAG: alpha/beta fold hydrolase [Inhella sp.]|jgi:pimeloyl-ACP methyl ester carboxylesterase
MSERLVRVGAHELCVRDEGPRDGEVLLLIMGLGLQLIAWPQGLVELWTARGFRVIRFDHRDIGHSSPQDHAKTPPLAWAALRAAVGLPLKPPYSLKALAEDAAGLLSALGIARAQVLGVSMGGMVAQHLALQHPEKVSALHLWMTTSGARHLPWPKSELRRLMLRRPRTREAALGHYVRLYRALAGPAYPTPEAELQTKVEASASRSWRPEATLRQLLAIAHDGDRSHRLQGLPKHIPVSIVHGEADPMLPLAHAHHLAQQLPQARFQVIPGWGHDLPAALWPALAASVGSAA